MRTARAPLRARLKMECGASLWHFLHALRLRHLDSLWYPMGSRGIRASGPPTKRRRMLAVHKLSRAYIGNFIQITVVKYQQGGRGLLAQMFRDINTATLAALQDQAGGRLS